MIEAPGLEPGAFDDSEYQHSSTNDLVIDAVAIT
jgi:hypothetical protein